MKTAKTKEVTAEVKPSKVKLVSYSMKMVIPTGAYANIQPEIIVKAGTVEQAHDFIAPHMNKLWKEYYMISERRLEPVKVPVTPPPAVTPVPVSTPPVEQSPVSGVAFLKATQAIQSCLSIEALSLIKNQIEKSVKLEKQEKLDLLMMTLQKEKEINAKDIQK